MFESKYSCGLQDPWRRSSLVLGRSFRFELYHATHIFCLDSISLRRVAYASLTIWVGVCVCPFFLLCIWVLMIHSFLTRGWAALLTIWEKNNINLLQGAHVLRTLNSIIIPILNRHNAWHLVREVWLHDKKRSYRLIQCFFKLSKKIRVKYVKFVSEIFLTQSGPFDVPAQQHHKKKYWVLS